MRYLAHLLTAAILAGLATTGPAGAQTKVQAKAQAAELKKVHILMVFDNNAKELDKSLRIDKRRMINLWKETIPVSRRTLQILENDDATSDKILSYYEKLKVGRDEGLVFYYAGHGATDESTNKHILDLRTGKKLPRDLLIQAMEAKKAGLVLLLTDCCSTPQEFKDEELVQTRDLVQSTERITDTVRSLLFCSRGRVDITAATDNASWSDNLKGGIFTRSLYRMFKTPIDKLDGDKKGFVTWREFYPQLQTETQSLFGVWRKEMNSRGEKVDERKQVPHAYQLGKSFAVLGISNPTKETMEYQCRWAGEKEWTSVKLEPGQKKVHVTAVTTADGPLPKLEMKIGKAAKVHQVKSREYTGETRPTEATLNYAIRLPETKTTAKPRD